MKKIIPLSLSFFSLLAYHIGYAQQPTYVEGTIVNKGSNTVEVFGNPSNNYINALELKI
ncbi:MAG: hypothetical protein WDM71_06695 [Ferruginibacter sp.]